MQRDATYSNVKLPYWILYSTASLLAPRDSEISLLGYVAASLAVKSLVRLLESWCGLLIYTLPCTNVNGLGIPGM